MTVAEFLLFLGVGRVLTWLVQVNGLLQRLRKQRPLLDEFVSCDLCIGFWIYLALALLSKARPFGLWHWMAEVVALAALSTLGAHLLRLGWQVKFGVTIIN